MKNKILSVLLVILFAISSFGQDTDRYSKLASVLDSIYTEDQKCQRQYAEIQNKYGLQSEELVSYKAVMREKYSHNLLLVSRILDENGWLGEEAIGHRANMALFLVIQHSELEAQVKYLPLMREAVKKGNAGSTNLALLEDRVALRQGRRQIYGTQLAFDEVTGESHVEPLEDPDNVDKRRAEMGLEPLKDYLSKIGLKWDPEAYKEILPLIEEKSQYKK